MSTPPRPIPLLPPSLATSLPHFQSHHLLSNLPVLFPPQTTDSWAVHSLWRSPHRNEDETEEGREEVAWEYLASTYSGMEVSVVGDTAEGEDEPTTFGQLLNLWKEGRGRGMYLKDWHLPLLVHLEEGGERGKEKVERMLGEVPECWRDDWMNEWYGSQTEDDFRFVYAGGGDSWTAIHRDVYCSYSISTNIIGAKLWYLFPPSCTPSLLPLLREANYRDEPLDVRRWSSTLREDFVKLGMMEVRQERGETIFIPSGWYHQVLNLSHPTISINHNWCNAYNIRRVYESMGEEVGKCRESIEDVRVLLESRGEGKEGWKKEWQECVDGLVEQSAGWTWSTLWKMTLHVLHKLEPSCPSLSISTSTSRWPQVPPTARAPTDFIISQIRPILEDFHQRREEESRWTEGLKVVLDDVEVELKRLEKVVAKEKERNAI